MINTTQYFIGCLCAFISGFCFRAWLFRRKLKNDWSIVWMAHADMQYVMVNNFTGVEGPAGFEKLRYEIQYSKSRNKYRLGCFGSHARDHSKYNEAVQMYNRFNDSILNEGDYKTGVATKW